jgi:hypothetical protein
VIRGRLGRGVNRTDSSNLSRSATQPRRAVLSSANERQKAAVFSSSSRRRISRASKYALESPGERIFLRNLRTTPDDTERDFSGKQTFEGVVGLNPSRSIKAAYSNSTGIWLGDLRDIRSFWRLLPQRVTGILFRLVEWPAEEDRSFRLDCFASREKLEAPEIRD